MNILLITARSDLGGGPRHVLDLIQNASDPIRFYLAAPPSGELADQLQTHAHASFNLPHRRFNLGRAFGLLQFCRTHNIEIIHSHGRGAGSYSRFLALFGFRVIHTFHGANQESPLKCWIESPLQHLTEKFICVSQSEKEIAIQQGLAPASKIQVIPNGTKIYPYNPQPFEHPLRLGMLARFDEVKGHAQLMLTLSKLSIPFHCYLAGDGEDLLKTQDLAKSLGLESKVHFLGAITDTTAFYQSIDIYLSFSRSEGLPLTVIEALAHSKPVLLSDIPAHREIVKSDERFLFNRENFQDFVGKIQKITPDQTLGLYSSISKNYDLNLMITHTHQTYFKN
jgi:glycosyltransferase involved in cell wall biosynthesis